MNDDARPESLFLVTFEECTYLFLGLVSKVECDLLTTPAMEIIAIGCHARDEHWTRPWNGQMEGLYLAKWMSDLSWTSNVQNVFRRRDGPFFHGLFTTRVRYL